MSFQADDVISRCIIYNRGFKNNAHVNSALFIFMPPSDEKGLYHESGVLRRLSPIDEDVHRIGCKIAAIQNVRKKNPPPGPDRRYYCGFRSAHLRDMQLNGDGYNVDLILDNEGGEASHIDLALSVEGTSSGEKTLNRADAGLALAYAFGLPQEHCCEIDKGDEHHPLVKYPGCLTADLSIDSIYLEHQEKYKSHAPVDIVVDKAEPAVPIKSVDTAP